jgi:multiple sugar transport system ATP-binding protein
MSVFDNLAFGLRQRRTPKSDLRERVSEAARMLEIEHLLQRRPRELSGGQRQRVALGRAIVRRPSVFLMDEPLSNLDAQLRVHTRSELAALHRKLATTFIYVTHDQVEAMTLGTRIAVMREGELQQLAAPRELYERPANTFVASFIGSPPMNLLQGEVERLGEGLGFVAGDLRLPLPPEVASRVNGDRKVTLGLRPEHFQREPGGGVDGIDGSVSLVEPLGSDTFVTIGSSAGEVVARLEPSASPVLGEHTLVFPDLRQALLFSTETGRRLG